jgi:hypothetical protein
MNVRLATIAAAAALLASVPAYAAMGSREAGPVVPQSVIEAGPQNPDVDNDNNIGWGQGELAYLHEVCPTVLRSPGQYNANLVQFCHEPHG